MEPDLEFMPLPNLQMLNNSLEKLKNDAVLRLHALQKVNHDLLTDNARLRQRTRDLLRQKREQTQQPGRSSAASRSADFSTIGIADQNAASGLIGVYARTRRKEPISILVQRGPDFTAVVETRVCLTETQLRSHFHAEPSNLQYKMILIETKDGVVENASTVVTRNAKVTLRKLQAVYHVTVHCTVPNSERRLTAENKFLYQNLPMAQETPPQERPAEMQQEQHTPISVGNEVFSLNVQVGVEEYLTCSFVAGDDPGAAARQFVAQHRLKPVLLDGLITALEQLQDSGVTIRNVDVSDLL
ncbi:uncharacterized protein BXIN_2567 [Babesia sp. Xinjiang]|uniref:uncharacterized protein n=1 Tax=Babesia sp. Xinjiang TaxID=462227 RepID=UPI000A239505|nr:uncharacterized protein BXIN_2567 [Babesia sp. Xinjiang]ORM41471.1 hypothetical protein BXIN_2567 [Babesia sp. Xinjiang]